MLEPVQIKKDIHWIGAVDYESRNFHGYSLSPDGTTYNNYLILDEKKILIDTVKADHASVSLERLGRLIRPEDVDWIVINHVEPDHAGALPFFMEKCRPEAVFCSPMGEKALLAHFRDAGKWPLRVVKSGDSVSIGKRSLSFLETRMLHWPDSMFCHVPEEGLLFSNDGFGQNIASSERFADEVSRELLSHALSHYYHNIVLPYSRQVLQVLAKVSELKLDIAMIAPDHGLIFRRREDVDFVLESYRNFAEQKTRKQAVIVYDTMWRSTERMAYSIAEGLAGAGVPCRIMSLKGNHHSAVMAEVARCGLVVVGSPTHNNGILPFVAGFLAFMRGLRPQNRLGAAFGSFGWSGESVKIIEEHLSGMGFDLPVQGIRTQYVPDEAALEQCCAFGQALGKALVEKCAG
ncbi:MAG: flavodoxin domain-containing protein [Desulfovibrio sp.]|jgi:flavorubredoxin|nr:flavodoxin domain-containing protein [Desulfovibrio sp.]